ncbi:MAG: helix-turn-helix domain-containing protein [Candidatus Pacebacteria bacterium]|nr:helix-turn-helix domain-containing protein [Candidatus Paceibacterota bacterium]MDR3583056.1 helix-turn-helix domain-containing protein [Candidatus Paceibacterota bacterium]
MNTLNRPIWFFPAQPLKLLDEYDRWRQVAKILKLSKEACLRLEWIIYYCEGHAATSTARHYGISRKTFYKWFKVFDRDNLYSLYQLEDKSKAPKKTRQREITPIQEQRIIQLRKRYIRWGKEKLAVIYQEEFGEKISAWKIQKVIENWKLYYHPQKAYKNKLKRRKNKKKKRITELKLDKKVSVPEESRLHRLPGHGGSKMEQFEKIYFYRRG